MRELGPKGAETRKKIVEAASHLFLQKGYVRTSMEEIAAKVGITKPAIYNYFDSKQEILNAILVQVRESWGDSDRQIRLSGDSLEEKFRGLHRLHVQFLDSRSGDLLWILSSAIVEEKFDQSPDSFISRLKDYIGEIISDLTSFFREEKAAGHLKPGADPRHAALVLFMVLSFFNTQRRTGLPEMDANETEKFFASFLDLFLHGVANE